MCHRHRRVHQHRYRSHGDSPTHSRAEPSRRTPTGHTKHESNETTCMELFVDIGTLLPVGTVVVAASPLMVPPSVSPSLPAHSIPIRRTPHNASALIAAAAATARTSPRLDACAAFFTGVPRHEPSVVASYSTDAAGGTGSGTGGGETKKKFLISASKQGEIVHWVSKLIHMHMNR